MNRIRLYRGTGIVLTGRGIVITLGALLTDVGVETGIGADAHRWNRNHGHSGRKPGDDPLRNGKLGP